MTEIAQRSVFARPWYWLLIGAGLAAIAVLLTLTVVVRAGAQGTAAQPAQKTEQDAPRAFGDGSTADSPLKPDTSVEMTYMPGQLIGTAEEKADRTATVRVLDANFDATAEALAEDPWADLMLDPGQKLVIIDFEITNHANEKSAGITIGPGLQLADRSGKTYDMDVVQIALDQDKVLGTDYPKEKPVRAVGVYTVPDDLDADSAVVQIKTDLAKLKPGGDRSNPDDYEPVYTYAAAQ